MGWSFVFREKNNGHCRDGYLQPHKRNGRSVYPWFDHFFIDLVFQGLGTVLFEILTLGMLIVSKWENESACKDYFV